MQQMTKRLGAFITENRLSQKELAKAAGVSQSTVSRALKGVPERHGGARAKLLSYVSRSEPRYRKELSANGNAEEALKEALVFLKSQVATIANLVDVLARSRSKRTQGRKKI